MAVSIPVQCIVAKSFVVECEHASPSPIKQNSHSTPSCLSDFRVNDPVAKKLLQRAEDMPKLEAPEDETIKTLFVAGMDARVKEEDIRCVSMSVDWGVSLLGDGGRLEEE